MNAGDEMGGLVALAAVRAADLISTHGWAPNVQGGSSSSSYGLFDALVEVCGCDTPTLRGRRDVKVTSSQRTANRLLNVMVRRLSRMVADDDENAAYWRLTTWEWHPDRKSRDVLELLEQLSGNGPAVDGFDAESYAAMRPDYDDYTAIDEWLADYDEYAASTPL